MTPEDRALKQLRLAKVTSPQVIALGLHVVELQPRVLLKVPYREDLIGEPDTGVLAGGVITTLLDTTCGWAVALELEEMTSIATLDLRIDYMRAATPGKDVFATAECYKITRSIAFVRAHAYDADPQDPVAAAQGTFILDSNAGRAAGANLRSRGEAGGAAA
ncbi:MAG TPA: PaaI family thioesterase [Caulobacteraceae bacterium]|jgi:uncharacterized protein (TIGR00369 family)